MAAIDTRIIEELAQHPDVTFAYHTYTRPVRNSTGEWEETEAVPVSITWRAGTPVTTIIDHVVQLHDAAWNGWSGDRHSSQNEDGSVTLTLPWD